VPFRHRYRKSGTMREKDPYKIRIVIATHAVGSGHKIFGDLICEKLTQEDDFDPVCIVEDGGAVDEIYGFYVRHADFWMKIMNRINELPVFDCLDFYKNKGMYARAVHVLRKENPDIVIATRFSQSIPFSVAKKVLKMRTLVINAVPDYGPPLRRDYPRLDVFKPDYLMVTEDGSLREALKKFRMNEGRVLLCGHDTRTEFRRIAAKIRTKEAAREAFLDSYEHAALLRKFDFRKKTVLLMGGSKAAARLMPVMRRLPKARADVLKQAQYCIACGTDQGLFHGLVSMKEGNGDMENIFPLPRLHTENMALLMAGCDVPVLGSIAPASLNELCETRCLPLIIFRHIAHEGHHVRYVQDQEIGFYEPRLRNCLRRLAFCLSMDSGEKEIYGHRAGALRARHRNGFHSLPRLLKSLHEKSLRQHEASN